MPNSSLWVGTLVGWRRQISRSAASVDADRTRAEVWSELADAVAGLGEGRSPDAVLTAAVTRLRRATGADRAVVWLNVAGRVRPQIVEPPGTTILVRDGLPAESDCCAEIRYGGERLGAVELTGPALEGDAPRLVREVATAAASVVHTLVVREALRDHVALAAAQHDELSQARSDLVTRQNAERRRVASDIHDGCQQRMTVIAGKIGLIRTLTSRTAPDDTAEAAWLRAELDSDIQDLIDALNAITSGQRPPRLDQSGLATALRREFAGLSLEVVVTGDPGPLPKRVEESAYYCCLEAVQNAATHSGGRHVEVSLRLERSALVFEVRDDGRGFDANREVQDGAGLDNLRRRVSEHNGWLQVVASDSGTALTGSLPVVASVR